jgi:hypothetical protein
MLVNIITYWLLSVPNFRFGDGFVVGMVVLAFTPLIQFIFERFGNYWLPLFLLVASTLLAQQVHVILGSTRDDTHYTQHLILPLIIQMFSRICAALMGRYLMCTPVSSM